MPHRSPLAVRVHRRRTALQRRQIVLRGRLRTPSRLRGGSGMHRNKRALASLQRVRNSPSFRCSGPCSDRGPSRLRAPGRACGGARMTRSPHCPTNEISNPFETRRETLVPISVPKTHRAALRDGDRGGVRTLHPETSVETLEHLPVSPCGRSRSPRLERLARGWNRKTGRREGQSKGGSDPRSSPSRLPVVLFPSLAFLGYRGAVSAAWRPSSGPRPRGRP
jgi:hypothetical protein